MVSEANIVNIGVFFDGTANNMRNDIKIGDGTQTNIAKLFQLYKQEDGKNIKIYSHGAGAIDMDNSEIEIVKNSCILTHVSD